MSKSEHLSKIEDASNEFQDSIISGRKLGNDRYSYSRNRKSQLDGGTSNSVIVKDKGTGTQYTISVNVNAVRFEGKKAFTTDDRLDVIQAAVTKFLENIHEEL